MKKTQTERPPFAELRLDPGFKAVYMDKANKELLIDLINTVLPPDRKVADIEEYLDREIEGYTAANKSIRIDVRCRDIQGRHFIVEMQNRMFVNFFGRCVHYASQVLSSTVMTGNVPYRDIHPVYVISLLNYDAREPELRQDNGDLISHYTFMNAEKKNFAPNIINVIFVRLKNARRRASECCSDEELFFHYFAHMGRMTEMPQEMGDERIRNLFAASAIANFTPEKRLEYDNEMRGIWDQKAIEHQIRMDGFEEGMAEGEAKGKAEGKMEERVSLIKAMLANGMNVETLARATGISAEEIKHFAGAQ